jgi:MFS family permease
MRRLLVFAGAVVFVDTIFFAALAPLVPYYAERFGLSELDVGVLTALVAAGSLVGAVPSGVLVTRLGVARTLVVGLVVTAAASAAFGFASSVAILELTRFAQGFGSAISWTAILTWLVSQSQPQRRGEVLGLAMGTAIFGSLFGPLVGAAAELAGPGPVFLGIAGFALALAALAATMHGPGRAPSASIRGLFPAMMRPQLAGGVWVIALGGLVFGVVVTLAPLQLDFAGWGGGAIAAVFLLGAALAAVGSPLVGVWSDRRGRARPLRVLFVASTVLLLALGWVDSRWLLAVLVIAAVTAESLFWTPGAALLTDGVQALRIPPEQGFVIMNLAYGPGQVVGSIAGGGLAALAGDAAAYLVLAVTCAATLVVLRPADEMMVAVEEP